MVEATHSPAKHDTAISRCLSFAYPQKEGLKQIAAIATVKETTQLCCYPVLKEQEDAVLRSAIIIIITKCSGSFCVNFFTG
jgi:hypothetical protein